MQYKIEIDVALQALTVWIDDFITAQILMGLLASNASSTHVVTSARLTDTESGVIVSQF